jgi:hypothetical protein
LISNTIPDLTDLAAKVTLSTAARAFLFVTNDERLKQDDAGTYNVTLKEIEA